MSVFLSVLTAYYLCDATARERMLTRSEWETCFSIYDEVKEHFDTGGSGPAENRARYKAFKEWEAANPGLVAEARTEAIRRRRDSY